MDVVHQRKEEFNNKLAGGINLVARRIESKCSLCRREGVKLFLKGMRCLSVKCAIEKRNFAPGQHGQRRTKVSDYGVQLREKQKMKKFYGVLERQFRNAFDKAARMKGVTGSNLVQLMERRLDNVVYRLLWSTSRDEARQIVRHKKVFVNGKILDIPSYLVKVGDVIEAREDESLQKRVKETLEKRQDHEVVSWLEVETAGKKGKIARFPEEQDAGLPVEVQQIVELFSK